MSAYSPLLEQLVEISALAAKLVLEIYQSGFEIELKGPNDPVTTADRRANQLICEALHDAFPGCPVVAEESEPTAYGDFQHAPRVFFVDPIDGTREFVRRTGEFVVMIGCVEDCSAVAGVIWAPTTGTVWMGQRGVGAFRREANQTLCPLALSHTSELGKARILVSRAQSAAEVQDLRKRLNAPSVVAMGSAGLKGASVADGTADGYVAPRYAGKRWDACAPDAIVSAAGGVFTDSAGTPIDYRSEDIVNRRGLVAANETLHRDLVRSLRRPAR